MNDIFTLDSLITILMLIFLQIVLGFDNLLYISIESRRVEPDSQSFVRRTGLALAIIFRLALLYIILMAVNSFQHKLLDIHLGSAITGSFNLHSIIVLFGGFFIVYTALKEIHHMLSVDEIEHVTGRQSRSVTMSITMIVIMNLIFSFDSILSAMALTRIFILMAIAIIVSGIFMIWLSDQIAEFLKRNRMFEVLGLFILLIVGVMLLADGGHLAHLHLFGQPVEPMAKTTFYFVIISLVVVDVIQTRYQRKLAAQKRKEIGT